MYCWEGNICKQRMQPYKSLYSKVFFCQYPLINYPILHSKHCKVEKSVLGCSSSSNQSSSSNSVSFSFWRSIYKINTKNIKSHSIFFENCSEILCEKIVLVIKKKLLQIQGWRPRIFEIFEISRKNSSDSERSEQFFKQNTF